MSALASPGAHAEDPVVFVSIADLHCLDHFLLDPVPTDFVAKMDRFFEAVAAQKPAFVIMPGDLGGQHWWNTQDPFCPQRASPEEQVRACADIAYPALKSVMRRHGLTTVFPAVGDHEIGDNNWPLGVRSDMVPVFKDAFARHFTEKADGTSRFQGSIGGVPMRPIGTPYARTSYAFLAGSALFIAVDEFRQDDPSQTKGLRGSVEVTVGDDGHLQWLEALLVAARADGAIKQIFVYGHVPVLSAVRAVKSSAMYLDSRERSAFWRLLRKYRVDAYLSGEVHAGTVIKDGPRSLFQVVGMSDCNGYNGLLVGRLYSDHVTFDQVALPSTPPTRPGTQPQEGQLLLDRRRDRFGYSASGEKLTPIDPDGLLLHFPFADDPANVLHNRGSFGSRYDASATGVQRGEGPWFRFDDAAGSQVRSAGITPLSGDMPRTVSVWIRTDRDSVGAYLYPSGKRYRPLAGFRLLVAHGVLGLELDRHTRVMASQGVLRLDDGLWHHVAVSFPGPGSTPVDLRFYIDGRGYSPATKVRGRLATEATVDEFRIGSRRDDSTVEGWTGELRDFALWGSALNPAMAAVVSSCANTLDYDAGDLEPLFRLYRGRRGTAVVNGRTWRYAESLTAEPGKCELGIDPSATVTLQLDATGRGVVGTLP